MQNPISNELLSNNHQLDCLCLCLKVFDNIWLNCHILFQDELLQIFIGDGRTIRIFSFSDIGLTTLALEIDFGNSCSQENLLWHRWENSSPKQIKELKTNYKSTNQHVPMEIPPQQGKCSFQKVSNWRGLSTICKIWK